MVHLCFKQVLLGFLWELFGPHSFLCVPGRRNAVWWFLMVSKMTFVQSTLRAGRVFARRRKFLILRGNPAWIVPLKVLKKVMTLMRPCWVWRGRIYVGYIGYAQLLHVSIKSFYFVELFIYLLSEPISGQVPLWLRSWGFNRINTPVNSDKK